MGGIIMAGIILSTQRETCSIATLSAAYLTWTASGSSQGRRGERPATIRQSQGTAFEYYIEPDYF
jgi:hypothetical protein